MICQIFRLFFLLCAITFAHDLSSKNSEKLIQTVFKEGITADLREPIYLDGVLTTTQGGIITGPDLRIQAEKMVYTRKLVDGVPHFTIEAENNLMVEIGEYIIIGKRLEYNFQEKKGVVYEGKISLEPWFIGGEVIELCPDDSYIIHEASITTSENAHAEWEVLSEQVTLKKDHFFNAKNTQFLFNKSPLFWLTTLNTNLETLFHNPLRYSIRFGGKQGMRLGLSYNFLSIQQWKAFARFDMFLKGRFGGGVEIKYHSLDGKEKFQAINYAAHNISKSDFNDNFRYRFQGLYTKDMTENNVTINLHYDKLSDKKMLHNYNDRAIELETSGRTQLDIRKQWDFAITNFLARVRINRFQTVKQEFPTLKINFKPFEIGSLGIISENKVEASYLDFTYAHNSKPVEKDYNATRVECVHNLYRPFNIGVITFVPEAGTTAIFYGNDKEKSTIWAVSGQFGAGIDTHIYRFYSTHKHVITPYAKYTYYTFPTTSPNNHYIFDITDGLFRLNTLKFGMINALYARTPQTYTTNPITLDLYAHAFFNTPTLLSTIPKAYATLTYYPFSTIKQTLTTAWDLHRHEFDHINARIDWTLSENCAIATEIRHREAFDWRKVDPTNFILDSFRSVKSLRRSPLSDKRDTLLMHLFYRFHPNLAVEFESSHGWNRHKEPCYNEFEVNLHTTLRSVGRVKLSYQHNQDDDRVALYISLGL